MAFNTAPDPTGPQMGRVIIDALIKSVAKELEKQMLEELQPIIDKVRDRIRETAEAAAREMEPTIHSALVRDNGPSGYGDMFKVLIQIKAPGEKWDPDEERARAGR